MQIYLELRRNYVLCYLASQFSSRHNIRQNSNKININGQQHSDSFNDIDFPFISIFVASRAFFIQVTDIAMRAEINFFFAIRELFAGT